MRISGKMSSTESSLRMQLELASKGKDPSLSGLEANAPETRESPDRAAENSPRKVHGFLVSVSRLNSVM